MDVVAADSRAVARVLVVADWAVDPHGVLAACRRRAASGAARFAIVVPARLHGIDWIGDPYASRPCAGQQVDALVRLAGQAGIEVELAAVGDPDPTRR